MITSLILSEIKHLLKIMSQSFFGEEFQSDASLRFYLLRKSGTSCCLPASGTPERSPERKGSWCLSGKCVSGRSLTRAQLLSSEEPKVDKVTPALTFKTSSLILFGTNMGQRESRTDTQDSLILFIHSSYLYSCPSHRCGSGSVQ